MAQRLWGCWRHFFWHRAQGALIIDGPAPPLVWPRHDAEQSIASFFVLSRKWTGRSFDALSVAFVHDEPPNAEVLDAAFLAGFADTKAFREAFVRRTGATPRAYLALHAPR
jgi:hypothetical protein